MLIRLMRRTSSLFAALLFLLAGCTVIDVQADAPLGARERWALLPVLNLGETPQAGERVEEMLLTLARTEKGIELTPYAPGQGAREGDAALDLDERQRYEKALLWAREQKFTYGLSGSVQEWRYRSSSDGEAAVGLTIKVIDVKTGRVLFSASGSRSGWGRDTASGTAQLLLRSLLSKMSLR